MYGYGTVAYSGNGAALWTNTYAGGGNGFASPSAINISGRGQIFVTGGVSIGSGAGFGTVAYSEGGEALWTNVFNGAYSNDWAAALAVDGLGDVFVTGTVMTSTNTSEYATLAYSWAGVPLWTNRFCGAGNTYASPSAAAADAHGNIFVTGTVGNGNNVAEYATVAYTRSGVALWTNAFNGGYTNDSVIGLAIDSIGTVFVTGNSLTSTNGNVGYATVAYSGAGTPLWTNWYRGPGNQDTVGGIAVDGVGNVFVTGSSADPSGDVAYATVAYSGSGIPLWTNRSSMQGKNNSASAIAVDATGDVIVTGTGIIRTVDGYPPDYRTALAFYTTVKYSPTAPVGRLAVAILNDRMVLRWIDSGLNLQSSPVVNGTFTNVPGVLSPYSISLQGSRPTTVLPSEIANEDHQKSSGSIHSD
jgi:hypothetical protein